MPNTLVSIVYVGIGGILGATLRYVATLTTQKVSISFPVGTLLSNLVGCFVIGVVAGLATRTDILPPEARLFLATGLCGALTTLSSMVYELDRLLEDREILLASGYFAATFVGAMVCFYLGSLLITLMARG